MENPMDPIAHFRLAAFSFPLLWFASFKSVSTSRVWKYSACAP